jgi:acyl-CoA thioester hydrolase
MEREGLLLPVIEAHVRYRAPARYDDLLRVETAVVELRRVSLRFEYRVVRVEDGELLAEGHTVHACVDPQHRPVRLPDGIRELLAERL